MHRSDKSDLVVCSDCGASVNSGCDREFEFGGTLVLCFECSLNRGGRYDEAKDLWSHAPTFDDIEPGHD
jgi:hypothetical protein